MGKREIHAAVAAAALLSLAASAGAQVTIGLNFTGSNLNQSGFIPPDTMGAVGPTKIVELINGVYGVYDKTTGANLSRTSLDSFWNTAFTASGAGTTTSSSFDPRVVYDPSSQRWYAAAADGADTSSSRFLVAVSNTSDPTAGWKGFAITADSAGTRWADYPTLGLNGSGVFLSANTFPNPGQSLSTNVTLVSIPKSSLTAVTPSVTGATKFENQDPNGTGYAVQPVLDTTGGSLPEALISQFNSTNLKRSSITGTITSPTLSTSGGFITINAANAPPDAVQPNGVTPLSANDARLDANAVLRNGIIWTADAINVNGRAGVQWYKIRASDNALLQSGTIADPSLAFIFPSIAVNDNGDVVMGFSGASSSQFASTYAVVGSTTSGGVTTFGTPFLTKAGVATYSQVANGENRWGDYSATMLDPSNPNAFWTVQEFASSQNVWSTQFTEILVPEPGTIGLAVGLGSLMLLRRRRQPAVG